MCGRAVQTRESVAAAAKSFGLPVNLASSSSGDNVNNDSSDRDDGNDRARTHRPGPFSHEWRDNFNLSPGMDAMVFYKGADGKICMDRKVWGLVTKRGTKTSPLPLGMGKHFEGLMFNARSDTLYQKPTFGRLASIGKSCIIALNGFFEWKGPTGKGKKQPYFVRRKPSTPDKESSRNEESSYLLMAGLWNQVPTGWEDSPNLDTFTIITTEVCQPLAWLHSRMPVCVWDESLARQWIETPTEKIHNLLDKRAQETHEDYLDWYKVTSEMSSTKFRSADAIKPLPKEKSVKDYFVAMGSASKTKQSGPNPKEKESKASGTPSKSTRATQPESSTRQRDTGASPNATAKRTRLSSTSPKKKGTIDSFFQPKKTL